MLKELCFVYVFLVVSSFMNAQIFDEVSAEYEIDHSYIGGTFGAGISLVDFNQDGLDDISLPVNNGQLKFYLNTGDGFLDTVLIQDSFGEVKSILWVDYDNDSDLDISVTEYFGDIYLYENIGELTFVNVTEGSNLTAQSCSNFGQSWADVNSDGHLDLYVTRYYAEGACQPSLGHNLLFVSNGDKTFTERSEEYGVGNGLKMSFQSTFFDYNFDGLIDLHVINDKYFENTLYQNTGDGFIDVSEETGTNIVEDPMTNTVLDFDFDGDFDLFFTNTAENGNRLLEYNTETESYEDLFPTSGLENFEMNWGASAIDIDNNRVTDLIVNGGWGCETACGNKVFYNNVSTFVHIASVFDEEQTVSHGIAKADFNSDGKQDVAIINTWPYKSKVYLNNTATPNESATIEFVGTASNANAVGTYYEYYIGGVKHINVVTCGSDFLSQDSYKKIISMGSAGEIDSLIIKWPSGVSEIHYSIFPNENIVFTEGETYSTTLSTSGIVKLCDGESLMVEATGGYDSLLWSNGSSSSSQLLASPGDYFAMAYYENGLTITTDTLTIEPGYLPLVNSILVTEPSCYGSNNGEVAVFYTFGEQNELNGEYVFNGLSDGMYFETISSDAHCQIQVQFELIEPPALFSLPLLSDVSCFGEENGSVSISTFGGTPDYSTVIEDVDSPESLYPGTYNFTTIDGNGCSFNGSFSIEEPEELQISIGTIQHATESELGQIAFEVTGGTGNYSMQLNEDEVNSTELFNLLPGEYCIEVIDENLCQQEVCFTIDLILSSHNGVSSSDTFNFRIKKNELEVFSSESTSIDIYNIEGKLLKSNQISSGTSLLNLSFLSSGIYFIHVKSNNHSGAYKVKLNNNYP